MSAAQPAWRSIGSTERPTIFTLRLSNSGLIFAIYPSSVVHTGVKSFGCENSTAHLSPIQSWNLMRPSVVSASKSGAVSPSERAIEILRRSGMEICGRYRRRKVDRPVLQIGKNDLLQ